MEDLAQNISKTAGTVPGTLVHVGDRTTGAVAITLIDYNETEFQEKRLSSIEECFPCKNRSTVSWINIDGVHNTDIIEKVGANYNLHPLILEDIVNTDQRPKLEDFENYIFIVLKMLYFNEQQGNLEIEQISLILGSNYVISFQEKEGDVFNSIRERIRNAKGRIRKMGADYLTYAIMDAIVDSYYAITEKYSDKVEEMSDKMIENPNPNAMLIIQDYKGEMIMLRRSVWPLREVISKMMRTEPPLIQRTTEIYLRDIYDHSIQIIDTVGSLRDMVSGMQDIYLASVSNKMNEVMKVLTIFAAIFIPLTFITGIYGMNFKYMPEINTKAGYFLILGVMVALATTMVLYFKKKKWF